MDCVKITGVCRKLFLVYLFGHTHVHMYMYIRRCSTGVPLEGTGAESAHSAGICGEISGQPPVLWHEAEEES